MEHDTNIVNVHLKPDRAPSVCPVCGSDNIDPGWDFSPGDIITDIEGICLQEDCEAQWTVEYRFHSWNLRETK